LDGDHQIMGNCGLERKQPDDVSMEAKLQRSMQQSDLQWEPLQRVSLIDLNTFPVCLSSTLKYINLLVLETLTVLLN
jgi:hypothetical protein